MKALIEKKNALLDEADALINKAKTENRRLRIANLIAIMKSKQSLQGSIRLFQP